MKAVIYARYSSSTQTEQSIEGQLRECQSYAEKHDITIVDTYIDRAISGTTDEREQFQKMIRDSEKKLFDAIIVYKMDRFTRNRYDSAIYKTKLKKNGVKVLYACEHIPDGPEGIILESLLEGMAEFYSAELSQKIKRGMRESALKGHVTGGYLALGYKIAADKSFEIDESTAPIVKNIFKMYDDGLSVVEICKKLNSLGYKTSRNAEFNKNSMRSILKNEKYIGIYKCNDIKIEGTIPQIVEKELFDRVQQRIASNKKAPAKTKAKVNYLLSGKLYCGHCDIGMVGESGTSQRGKKHNYYICVNKKRKKTCNKKTVRKDWIENLVVSETIKNILQTDKIGFIAKKCIEVQLQDNSKNFELDHLNKQLSEISKSINNVMSAIEQGIISKTTKSRLIELEDSYEKIKYEIEICKVSQPSLSEENIKFMLSKFEISEELSEKYNSTIIECFINSVHLSDDKLVITYNLTNEKSELTRSDLNIIGGGEGS